MHKWYANIYLIWTRTRIKKLSCFVFWCFFVCLFFLLHAHCLCAAAIYYFIPREMAQTKMYIIIWSSSVRHTIWVWIMYVLLLLFTVFFFFLYIYLCWNIASSTCEWVIACEHMYTHLSTVKLCRAVNDTLFLIQLLTINWMHWVRCTLCDVMVCDARAGYLNRVNWARARERER